LLSRPGHNITLQIVIKYALFQLPELLLFALALIVAGRWMSIPTSFYWGFMGFLIAKDIIIFLFVWRAYDGRDAKRVHQLIGEKALVIEALNPNGVVRVNGELWKAEVSGDGTMIDKDEYIRVVDVKGFCLIVSKTHVEMN
jgi:membrane protein implicated in regulation of membrane protease activity